MTSFRSSDLPQKFRSAKFLVRQRRARIAAWWGLWMLTAPVRGWSAVETSPLAMRKTVVIVKLDSEEPLAIRTTFHERPPTIVVQFPQRRVLGTLPERAATSQGVIQTLWAQYDRREGGRSGAKRFLRALRIILRARYPYRVRSEPGRVIVEIDHPASVGSESVEMGLQGATVVTGFGERGVSERFRAMQEAMAQAMPIPWTLQLDPRAPGLPLEAVAGAARATPAAAREAVHVGQPSGPPRTMPVPSPHQEGSVTSAVSGVVVVLTLTCAAGVTAWLVWPTSPIGSLLRRHLTLRGERGRVSSGLALIDQLVWRAFERQGYTCDARKELVQPFAGTLRVITKGDSKAALLCVGNGPFFEKQTMEQVVRVLRHTDVEQAFLATSGSLTIPAQRLAKSHRVTLIGRDQLMELLSHGATSEYVARQLEQYRARLEELQATLRQHADELEVMRRQRNEASWLLGEERTTSAQLEAQLEQLRGELRRQYEAELAQWEREVSLLRTRWEESQWYLGESRARGRHLEAQLASVQDGVKRLEEAEHQRDETGVSLGEERANREALGFQLAQLQRALTDTSQRWQGVQDASHRLQQELQALRTHGERRRHARVKVRQASIELYGRKNEPPTVGALRDVSRAGISLETDQALPPSDLVHLRLQVPGEAPIESKARCRWRRSEGQPLRSCAGYRLSSMPASMRTLLERLVETAPPFP